MNIKKDKPKVYIYLTLVMLLVIAGITGFSYAYWLKHFEQRDENIIASSCFELSITEEQNDINLVGAKPISDEEGYELVPYTFRINNTCEVYGYVDVNLEIMDLGAEVKEILPEHIHAQLLKSKIELFDDVLNLEYETEPTLVGAHLSYRLNRQFIKANTYEDYEFRLWMDKDVTNDDLDTIGGSFKSKVSIIMHQTDPLFERSGTMVGHNDPRNFYTYASSYRESISKIVIENGFEDKSNVVLKWDASEEQDGSVIAILTTDPKNSSKYILYLQGIGGVILPENCEYYFTDLRYATTIENMELLDFSNVTDMLYAFSYFGENAIEDINLDLSSLNVGNVTNMQDMFYSCGLSAQKDINIYLGNDFNAKNCVNISNLMYSVGRYTQNESNININLGNNFNAISVTNMQWMFAWIGAYNNNLKSININFGDNFNLKNISKIQYMFGYIGNNSSNLILNIDLGKNFNCENCIKIDRMFDTGTGFKASKININFGDNFNANKVEKFTNFFNSFAESSTGEITIDFGKNFGGDSAKIYYRFFDYSCRCTDNININFGDHFNTSNARSMSHMFYSLGAATDGKNININFGNYFDTSNVFDMSYMFYYSKCGVDLNNFSFKSVEDIISIIQYNSNLYGHIYIDFNNINTITQYDFYSDNIVTNKKVYLDYTTATESKVDEIIASYDPNHCLVQKGNKVDEYTITINDSNVVSNKSLVSKYDTIKLSTNLENKIIKSFKLNGKLINGNTIEMIEENVVISDIDYYDIVIPNTITSNGSYLSIGNQITLSQVNNERTVSSFKLNGELIEGNTFIMPDEDVEITDVEFYDYIIIESEHNPYKNCQSSVVYYEHTFDGATSLTIELTYETEATYNDWIYLYTDETTIYQNKKYGDNSYYGGEYKFETINLDSDYIKIEFTTNYYYNSYYGFKAVITPHYD